MPADLSPEQARQLFAQALLERIDARAALAARVEAALGRQDGDAVFRLREELRQADAVLNALNADLYAIGLSSDVFALFTERCRALTASEARVRAAVAATGADSLDAWLASRGYMAPDAVPDLLDSFWDRSRDLLVILGAGSARIADELLHLGQRRTLTVDPTVEATQIAAPHTRPEIRNVHDLEALDDACREIPWPTPVHLRTVMVSPDCPIGLGQVVPRLTRTLQTKAEADFDVEDMIPFFAKTGVRNLAAIARLPSIDRLKGALAGRPAVVVAAGPSLDQNIAELAGAVGRITIVALNRTVPALRRLGIRPDVTVVLDPLDLRAQLDGFGPDDFGILVLGSSVDSSLFDLPGFRVATFASSPVAEGWIYETVGEEAGLLCGGTVGTGAISLAAWLGCTTIISIGRDLALSGGHYYAQEAGVGGHRIEVDQAANEIRFVSASDTLRVKQDGADEAARSLLVGQRYELRKVRGFYGSDVLTTSLFEYELDVLQRTLRELGPGLRFINATQGGAFIQGMEHLPLREALAASAGETFDARALLAERLDGVDRVARRRRFRAGCAEILEDLRHLTRLAARASRLGDSSQLEDRRAYDALLAEMAEVSRRRLLFSALVQRATRAISERTAASPLRSLDELRRHERGLFSAIDATLGSVGAEIETGLAEIDAQMDAAGETR